MSTSPVFAGDRQSRQPGRSAGAVAIALLARALLARALLARALLAWALLAWALLACALMPQSASAEAPAGFAPGVVPVSLQPAAGMPAASPAAAAVASDTEIKMRLDRPGGLTIGGEHLQGAVLRRFYAGHGYEPVWSSRPAQASALLDRVLHAGEHGLDPDLFHGAMLRNPAALPAVERDLLLSDAFLAYADALARGALPIDERMDDEDLTPDPVDVVAVLDRAIASPIASPGPAAAIEALAPNSPAYAALRRAYQSYRAIAAAGGWPRVAEGPAYAGALQRRLAAEGYLPPGDAGNGLDAATAAVIRAFQRHHDLVGDGRLNGATIAELNVGAEVRAQQVAANLERWRWLPRSLPADRVWVNAANAQLVLYRDNRPEFTTRVVVGETDKQTPELQTEIVGLLFNPPWNVPSSIAAKEILPKLSQQPGYLARHHMMIRSNGAIQQLPGPGSALGQLKFEMPNRFDVYLHDTPLKNLFSRDNRRQSHGCVRVQNPRELAALLDQQPVESINKGIALGSTNRRMLPAPVAVFIVYQTVFAGEEGSIEFRRDVYQRDEEIQQHLSRAQQAPMAQQDPAGQRRG